MDFPRFEGGDPRGWILKVEKYFCYYQTPDEHKVDIAAMYLEGDALDLFSWINRERTLLYWEELVKALQENYGPAEFQNPNEHLCSIRQTGSIQEYRKEFAKSSSRVTKWPDHSLLGVFMNGLKEELKSDVRIHKPRTVYKAMSLAMEFEQKVSSNRGHKSQWSNLSRSNTIQTGSARDVPYQSVGNQHVSRTNPNSTQMSPRPSLNRAWEIEKQNRIAKGLCFRCNEKFALGHHCKTSSLTLMEANGNIEGGESGEQMSSDIIDGDAGTNDLAEISFHAFLGNTIGTTMKLQGTLNGHKRYKLQGVPQESNAPFAFQYFSKEADTSEPNDLPPFRQRIHSIPLIPNSRPPNIRPYRYPYFQKLEIEKQKWKQYLLGHHFYVRTDHCSLKYLLSQRITTNEQQRLLMKLLPFDFTIVYKAGKDNLGADSLSRRPLNAEFLALAIPVPMDFSNWQNALRADTYTREIIQAIHHDPSLQPDFHLLDQKLYFKESLVIPDQSSIRQKLLSESHDTPSAGHGGYLKTLKRLSSNFFWPRMKHDVKIFVQNCLVCQQANYQALAPAGLLQPLHIVSASILISSHFLIHILPRLLLRFFAEKLCVFMAFLGQFYLIGMLSFLVLFGRSFFDLAKQG
ncbi:hypothetical protein KY290_027036 [Solanum tuberosum]|uniref:Uncharacterized protein n=1 Tax=Solanum tuberosum TaxID=4113 RepID=A0ABQ7UFH3_SOLTU|nr:hypothetical protein KY284_025996 [Solanum tuberosum]KAH0747804.1 hypothetical protein KY290_027036 [Solanum tuberosum]